MGTMTKIDELIASVVHSIQEQHGLAPGELTPQTSLIQDLGFSSLDIAQMVAMMESQTGIDPFAAGATLDQISTVESLTKLYSKATRLEAAHG